MSVTLDQIIDLAVSNGLFVEQMSRGYLRMACPFHQDEKPSLLVFDDGWCKCLGECDRSWKNETLYAELTSPGAVRRGPPEKALAYPPRLPNDLDALEELMWKAHDDLKRTPENMWYLEMRGVEDRVDTAKLGWYSGWITVPILSRNQRLTGMYMRSTPPQEKLTRLRFSQPEGQVPQLYCPDYRLWAASNSVAVVFGMMDALVLSSIRVPVITTTGGSNSFNPDWLNDWRKPAVIIPDANGDDIHAIDLAASLGWRGKVVRLQYDEQVSDPADFAKAAVGRKKDLIRQLVRVM